MKRKEERKKFKISVVISQNGYCARKKRGVFCLFFVFFLQGANNLLKMELLLQGRSPVVAMIVHRKCSVTICYS